MILDFKEVIREIKLQEASEDSIKKLEDLIGSIDFLQIKTRNSIASLPEGHQPRGEEIIKKFSAVREEANEAIKTLQQRAGNVEEMQQ